MIFPGTTKPKLPEGFKDASWHNDICSHYEKIWNGYVIDVWVAQDDPKKRECIAQYLIGIREPFECEFIEFREFTKNNFSEEGLNEVSREIRKIVYKLMKKYS